jgi:predicted permease
MILRRILNVFRRDRLTREIDEELQSHVDEARENGRDAQHVLRYREESQHIKLIPWLDSLRADAVFGFRQLAKRKITSAAAILSLALAIGACASAFRLIDALLLRPLPVTHPEQLYNVAKQGVDPSGRVRQADEWAHPAFRLMREAVKDQAELIAISHAAPTEVTYGSDADMEKPMFQYASGWMFDSFGIPPAIGRVLAQSDDATLGSNPVAVLSYDYWTRRFGRDPNVIGRTFRLPHREQQVVFQIVGVADERFTGTEPGSAVDIFVPATMNTMAARDDGTWHRIIARVKPGVALEPLRAKLHATARAFEEKRAEKFIGMTRQQIARILDVDTILEPASAGVSSLQREYREPLAILGILVLLVLLIAAANVANLMTAQAAAREREMALRVSIGAGRARLVQLVLVECAWIAAFASATGALFAWWSAPFIVGMINPPDQPARLAMQPDWRMLAFGVLLPIAVTILFGLPPALRASGVRPASALKGGSDPRSRSRLMHALIVAQIAFCFVVLFISGLFGATLKRLSTRPLGFAGEHVLTLDAIAQRAVPPAVWAEVVDRIRAIPSVESAALGGFPLLSGNAWNGYVSINGAPPSADLAYFLNISPGWLDTMRIPLVQGRDFRPDETFPGKAIVNQTFVRQYFNGAPALGQFFERANPEGRRIRFEIVGIAGDAPYRSIREPIVPIAFVPFHFSAPNGPMTLDGTLFVRTATDNPAALAPAIRAEITRARPDFHIAQVQNQMDLFRNQTIRERLLASLAAFFAIVAVLLAAVGLYGVLDYTVMQRRREIGIRLAIGARAADIARGVTSRILAMILTGAAAGLLLGIGAARYVQSLLYGVKATEPAMLAIPIATIVAASLASAFPAVLRALRIDPVTMLRSE